MGSFEIKYTIVICLHNSLDFLKEQLNNIHTQDVDFSAVEVLIIDNASRQEVSVDIQRVTKESGISNARYIYEPQVGAQYARNRGIEESRGEFLLYLDDDALPRPGWLKAMTECFTEDPNRVIQGRITLLYRQEKPTWMSPHLEMLLSEVDLGKERIAHRSHCVLANMAIPKRVFETVGGWDLTIGRKGKILLSGEDAELAMRADDTGKFSFYYCGDATVEHVVRDNRYHRSYHTDRSYWQGVTSGYLFKARPHTRKYSRSILSHLKVGCGSLVFWIALTLLRDQRAFTYKCRALSVVGFLYGLFLFQGLPTTEQENSETQQ